jgi:hypothetical protein
MNKITTKKHITEKTDNKRNTIINKQRKSGKKT